MANIQKAAEFLDSQVGNFPWLTADWRSKINQNSLNMISLTHCILGQLQGHYDSAWEQLELSKLNHDIQAAFAGDTRGWREYLSKSLAVKYPVDSHVWGKINKQKYTVLATYEVDGKRWYVLHKDGTTYADPFSELDIATSWTTEEPHTHKVGDVLRLKGRAQGVLILVVTNDWGIRIGEVKSSPWSGELSGNSLKSYTDHGFDVIGNIHNHTLNGVKLQ